MLVQTRLQGHKMKAENLRNHLAARGLAEKSIKDYYNAIYRAQDWMRAHHWTLDDCPASVIARYVSTLPTSRSTRNQMRSALKAYWEITGREDAPIGVIRVPRNARMRSRAISPEDASKLSRTAIEWEQGGEGLAVLLGLYLGLRAFEISKMRWDEFDQGSGTVTFVGKFDYEATLPVHPAIWERMAWWRAHEIDDPCDPHTRPGTDYLFQAKAASCRKPHITSATVWTWVKRLALAADVGDVTTHQLRHTCLTTLNDATGDLRLVQEFARHADPMVTAGYTRVNDQKMKGLLGAFDY